jgi:hypothetical protein
VSLIIGIAFWPCGTAAIAGDDLADAFRNGGRYSPRPWTGPRPAATAARKARSLRSPRGRLDEALRAYLTEQGTKRLANADLWALVMGAARLRLAAYAVASLPGNGNGRSQRQDRNRNHDLGPRGRPSGWTSLEAAGRA